MLLPRLGPGPGQESRAETRLMKQKLDRMCHTCYCIIIQMGKTLKARVKLLNLKRFEVKVKTQLNVECLGCVMLSCAELNYAELSCAKLSCAEKKYVELCGVETY